MRFIVVKGFFEADTIKSPLVRAASKRSGERVKAVRRSYTCEDCKLYKHCKSPRMRYSGKGKRKILLLGEGPGYNEDEEGIQFVGRAGERLEDTLEAVGIDMRIDCWLLNAVNCRPMDEDGRNRTPTDFEVKCCREFVWDQIKELNPVHIWVFGNTALKSLYKDRKFGMVDVTTWRNICIPDYSITGSWINVFYHPSFINRRNDESAVNIFFSDLSRAVDDLKDDHPVGEEWETKVDIVTDFDELRDRLQEIIDGAYKEIVYDYEATSLVPWLDDQDILTVSVAVSNDKAFAFPFAYRDFWDKVSMKLIRETWLSILRDSSIWKIAQNVQFEERWNRWYLKTRCEGWVWDTMVASHIIDAGRQKFTGLDFQAFVNWGIWEYDEKVNRAKKTMQGNRNQLEDIELGDLLLYNGLDSIFTYRLCERQKPIILSKRKMSQVWHLYFQGVMTFADNEEEGIGVDLDYYEGQEKELEKKYNQARGALNRSKEAKRFEEVYDKPLDLNSNVQLSNLLYKVLKNKPTRQTKKSKMNSVDIKSLLSLKNVSFVKNLLGMRKYKKIKDYIIGYKQLAHNGKLHPNFNLHIARSGRPSSDHPNFNNIPRRDQEANKCIRSGIIPSKGWRLLEVDYKAVEVCICACYSHDPVLIRYIKDPESDMHRDQAVKLFLLPEDKITKNLRHFSKNGFVFPQLYGSSYKPCAANIWNEIDDEKLADGTPVKKYLRNQGVKKFNDFVEVVREVEIAFWNKYIVTKEWLDDIVAFHARRGFVELLTGFRREGMLQRKEIGNTPIQGAAFQCLLWSLNMIHHELNYSPRVWESRVIGQIYDAIIFNTKPDELKPIIDLASKVMTEDLCDAWMWIIVPMTVEFEVTGIDKPWYDKKEVHYGKSALTSRLPS